MIHPNQSFIDKFNIVNKTDDSVVHFYGHKFKERQRKEKFKNFISSLNEENKKNDNSITEVVSQILNYNTLNNNKNKLIYETKQNIGSLPNQFSYNGHTYVFNPDLNMFINQHGHMIAIEQATAFMSMNQFEEVIDVTHDSSLDGSPRIEASVSPIPTPPTNFQATSIPLDGISLSWNDTSNNEIGFVIYSTT